MRRIIRVVEVVALTVGILLTILCVSTYWASLYSPAPDGLVIPKREHSTITASDPDADPLTIEADPSHLRYRLRAEQRGDEDPWYFFETDWGLGWERSWVLPTDNLQEAIATLDKLNAPPPPRKTWVVTDEEIREARVEEE